MLLIGSAALRYHCPTMEKPPADIDLVGTYDEAMAYRKLTKSDVCYPINSGRSIFMKSAFAGITEIEIAWEGSSAEKLLKFCYEQAEGLALWHGEWIDDTTLVPSLDILYLLKMSHRYKKDSPHFKKTMAHILFMRALGAKIRPEHEEFYQQRMKDTYTNTLPKLNQSKDGFFAAEEGFYKYDHDTLHEAVKHLDKPAYTFFQDGAVWCSKVLWDACRRQTQLYAAYEEITVLALERSIVPYPEVLTYREAFNMAHMKLATSISSGWFREFVWENYYDIQAMYSDDFVMKFELGLANGTVKLHKEVV